MLKRLGSLAVVFVALVSLAAGSAYAQTGKCQGAKLKAAGKKVSCLLGVRSKAAAKAGPADSTKLMACETKFGGAFMKAEAKPPCATTGDAPTIENAIDGLFAGNVAAAIALSPPSKCQGAKVKAAGKLASCFLGVDAKGAAKSTAPDTTKHMACKTKFEAALTKAEGSGDCGAAAGDTSTIEAMIGLLESDMVCQLGVGPACTCGSPAPTRSSFTTSLGSGNCGSTVNSSGSPVASLACNALLTGGGGSGVPPAQVPDYGALFTKTNCCGNFLALTATKSTDTGSNRNCTNANCLYGPPLPIVSALSVCVINTVAQPAAGYGDCSVGSETLDLPLTANIHLQLDLFPQTSGQDHCVGGTAAGTVCTDNTPCTGGGFCSAGVQTCPICAGDGKCHGGSNDGGTCSPGELLVTGPQWPTSHDCPPGPESPSVGALSIPYLLGTGTVTKTAVDEPSQSRVFCGFCSDPSSATFKNPAVPCTGDADCAAFTTGCGGQPCTACKQRSSGAFNGGGPARTITENGAPAGPIATGNSPASETLVSIYCIPPTFSAVDGTGDLPGPGVVSIQGQTQLLP